MEVHVSLSKKTMLASSFLAGMAMFTGGALAQDVSEEIVVTGSRIPQPNLVTTSPVTQVTAADVTTAGITKVEDLINSLPQAFAAQNSTVSNGATGTATVDLRGLGPVRTLVLVDGRRMPYGSALGNGAGTIAPDLNQIPTQLVDRVEILTGGASAVYGSDAIAGVVNFIMKKDFEGVQLDAQYQFYQHNNDYDTNGNLRSVIATRALTNPAEFAVPEDNVDDGYGREVSLLMGINAPDDRGNLTAYVTYRDNSEVLQRYRDYSACAIGAATATGFTCGGSSTNATGRFTNFSTFDFTIDRASGANRAFSGATDQYNFGPLNFYQRPDERYTMGAFGRYEISEHFEAYTQLMFTESKSVAQIAPSGAFLGGGPSGGGFDIACNNPLVSAAQRTLIGCSTADIASGATKNVLIGRRNVEGGGRQDDLAYSAYRAVVGLRGPIFEGWNYDVYGQFSRNNLNRTYLNDFSIVRTTRALDVVPGPGGAPTCRSVIDGTDPSCVPYNIWSRGGVTEAALDYLQTPGVQVGFTQQQIVSGAINGDLGFAFPTSEDTVKTAFGIEYRRDELQSRPDTAFSSGDLFGQGGATPGLEGATDAFDIFAEVQVPLVQDKPGFKYASIDAAYRYSDYNTGVTSDTYKVAGDWAPTDDLRLRGSFQKATRAANVFELFQVQGLNLFDIDGDPCGAARSATLAQCVATGVPAAAYGTAGLDSPAGQYNQLVGGNPNLDPEEAETYTLGFVLTPRFLEGFNLSIDYFNIEVVDTIAPVNPNTTVDQCYVANVASACARIRRNSLGNFWTAGGFVEATRTNIGGLTTSGVDVNANYTLDLNSFGTVGFNFTGTYLEELITDNGTGASGIVECKGFYGADCGIPNPEWRHRVRVSWQTPWDVDVSATWRHFGEVELFGTSAVRVDRFFDQENYFDLAGSWQVKEYARLRAGVNNVLDDDPQLSASVGTTGNGNTYPQTYDALGRYIFAGITLDF
jgi:outer membrane receptor protein involved in Fe transport